MPKRRAVEAESDSEDPPQAGSSGKRARFDHRGPIVNEYEQQPSEKARGKRRAAAADADDASDTEMVAPENAPVNMEEEQQFEEEHEEAIRESIRQRQKMQGVRTSHVCSAFDRWLLTRSRLSQGVAKFGIIESVEMCQFMCHKYLTFKFGPQINFIIGELLGVAHTCPRSLTLYYFSSGHNGSEYHCLHTRSMCPFTYVSQVARVPFCPPSPSPLEAKRLRPVAAAVSSLSSAKAKGAAIRFATASRSSPT
jgi:hypothetical protein